MRLGEQIRTARLRKGLSQTQLAEAIGTGQAQISKVERGRHSPQLATMDRLLAALETSLDKLRLIREVMPVTGGGRPASTRYGKPKERRRR